jgi:hypothetical protein
MSKSTILLNSDYSSNVFINQSNIVNSEIRNDPNYIEYQVK